MKHVLITGGSRGIGAACVEAFAKRGYKVTFTYNKSEDAAVALAEKTGATPIFCDLAVVENIEAAIKEAGEVDILINNAGVSHVGLITDISEEEYRYLMAVNTDAPFFVSRGVLPHMIRQQWGAIVNISSMWGAVGASCEVAYSASKAAVIGFTKALAKEVGPSGVRVNCILPGVIATDMNAHLSEEDLKVLADETPLCRIGRPEEVAEAAVYLAEATFVTGQCLSVDGGFIG
ncbi:MAG: SDR family oxidoreductase [Clostridia bacterium]|nr:SDR family oxidoreductase [Clostridia bacterium]